MTLCRVAAATSSDAIAAASPFSVPKGTRDRLVERMTKHEMTFGKKSDFKLKPKEVSSFGLRDSFAVLNSIFAILYHDFQLDVLKG